MIEIRFEPLCHLLLTGLPQLARMAWEETGFGINHPHLPYGPDWEAYQNMEDRHLLRFIALRENDRLIGYASVIVDTDPHCVGLLYAKYGDIYIVPEKRGYAARLIRFIESHMESIGVRNIQGCEREGGPSVGIFLERMGYSLQERIYAKTLNERKYDA